LDSSTSVRIDPDDLFDSDVITLDKTKFKFTRRSATRAA